MSTRCDPIRTAELGHSIHPLNLNIFNSISTKKELFDSDSDLVKNFASHYSKHWVRVHIVRDAHVANSVNVI